MFKKTLTVGIIALSTLSATGVFAAQPNSIRFEGEVSSQTCNISINDSTSAAPVILLQTAKLSELATTGQYSTPTKFSIKLTGCTDPGNTDQNVKIHFASGNVDANGYLKNIATSSAATNVAVQLLDPADTAINLSSGDAYADAFTLHKGETGGEAQFTARYVATGTATAGKVEASVQYAISYL